MSFDIKTLLIALGLAFSTMMFWQSKPKDSTDWHSPQTSCSLLSHVPGMQTSKYKNDPSMPKEYFCVSPYKEIGEGWPLKNNLAYYVTGDRKTARELKLVLNVNSLTTADVGHGALAVASGLLTKRALDADLTDEVVAALLTGQSGKWKAGKNRLEVLREDWPTGRGYEVKFIIR